VNVSKFARFRRTTATLLFLAAACSFCSGCQQVASQGMNAEGVRLYQQGDYANASQRFMKAIAEDANNPDGYYNLAATYHRLGKASGNPTDLEQAESFYNQCLDRDGDHVQCYRGLAVLLVETNRSDAAHRLLEGWKMRSPAAPQPRIELARLKQELGNRDAAKQDLLEALTIDPDNQRALTALARLREESGELSQALALYERSLASNPMQPQVANRVASLRTSTGMHSVLQAPGETRVVNQPPQWRRY